ncbi:FAD-dependent oxidoreductase, partial [Acinetobacter baumannii]
GDKTSHAAVRNMACCAVSGQGAGTAAAIAVKTGKGTRDLDIAAV